MSTRIGVDAELAVLAELGGGAYVLPDIRSDDLASIASVAQKYRGQEVGVADASIVVLAERYATRDILTLDHRPFSWLRPLGPGRFRLLP